MSWSTLFLGIGIGFVLGAFHWRPLLAKTSDQVGQLIDILNEMQGPNDDDPELEDIPEPMCIRCGVEWKRCKCVDVSLTG